MPGKSGTTNRHHRKQAAAERRRHYELGVIYVPWLRPWFRTTALPAIEWPYVMPLILIPFAVAELADAWNRRNTQKP
jgi:hypothetical protein